MFPDISQPYARELRAYPFMSEALLFNVYRVEVPLTSTMMPGPTRSKTVCTHCGIVVRDGCEVYREGKALCRPCAGDGYFIEEKGFRVGTIKHAPHGIDKGAHKDQDHGRTRGDSEQDQAGDI